MYLAPFMFLWCRWRPSSMLYHARIWLLYWPCFCKTEGVYLRACPVYDSVTCDRLLYLWTFLSSTYASHVWHSMITRGCVLPLSLESRAEVSCPCLYRHQGSRFWPNQEQMTCLHLQDVCMTLSVDCKITCNDSLKLQENLGRYVEIFYVGIDLFSHGSE